MTKEARQTLHNQTAAQCGCQRTSIICRKKKHTCMVRFYIHTAAESVYFEKETFYVYMHMYICMQRMPLNTCGKWVIVHWPALFFFLSQLKTKPWWSKRLKTIRYADKNAPTPGQHMPQLRVKQTAGDSLEELMTNKVQLGSQVKTVWWSTEAETWGATGTKLKT